jgi:hypothetical protein
MKEQIAIYRRPYFISTVMASICLAVVSASAWTLRTRVPAGQENEVPVGNKTQSFQVIRAVVNEGTVRISLKNGYRKAINGFTLSGGGTSGVQVDFTETDDVIAPGEIYEYRDSVKNLQSSSGSITNTLNLRVLAVVFEDGTGDGEKFAVDEIRDRRLGEKRQLSRLLPLINQALNSSDADMPAALKLLKAQVSSLPVNPGSGDLVGITGGLHHGKEDVLVKIRTLEEEQSAHGNVDLRKGLIEIKKHFERKAAKL